MTPFSTDIKVNTVTSDNYIDVKYEYFGPVNDDGLRLRTRDVWYATKPTVPEFHVVDNKDKEIPEFTADVSTAWTIGKAGASQIHIVDRDDINGLRELLNVLERDMDRRDMDELIKGIEAPGEEEDVD